MTGKITLIKESDIISNDSKIAVIMNNYFSNIVENLDIQGYNCNYSGVNNSDKKSNIIDKFKNHPSVLKIKERMCINEKVFLAQITLQLR